MARNNTGAIRDTITRFGTLAKGCESMKVIISRKLLSQARDVIRATREQCRAIDAQKDALPALDVQRDGLFAVEKRERELSEMEQAKTTIRDQGAATLKALRAQYDAALADQVTPKGADLDNLDYVLIRDQLIDSPQQLRTLAAKHDNLAFTRAVQKYAGERGWKGFDQGVNAIRATAEAAKDFGKTYFDLCDTGVGHLNGVAAMQISDEGEITRMAAAHGILGCLGD